MSEVKVVFNPLTDVDYDEIHITVSKKMLDILHQAVASKDFKEKTDSYNNHRFQRPSVKREIMYRYNEFNYLWSSEILNGDKIKIKGSYSEYCQLINRLKDSHFKYMIANITNREQCEFNLSINLKSESDK